MKVLTTVITLLASLVIFSAPSYAATYDFNYTTTSSLYTADDGTMTEWLHLDQYTSTSILDMTALLSSSSTLDGFEYATRADVGGLTQQLFGFDWSTLSGSGATLEAYNGYTDLAASFFGYSSGSNSVFGYTGDVQSAVINSFFALEAFNVNSSADYIRTAAGFTDTHTGYGHFVSRTVSPVPEPSTLALMLAGFGLIGFKSHRRNKLSA